MNPLQKLLTKISLTLAAGLFVFSAWAHQLPRPLPAMSLAQRHAYGQQKAKLALSERMAAIARDPKQLKRSDLRKADKQWGAGSAKMLELLRDSAR
jgi:hypothetical protein